ncbi:MAG TPA: Gfo/Idh/MocA family oxidoreductase [Gemmatimonadaceae bacterium]|nr:Gfo/Idh/MocA family oxidoreductase [Gemmatimonadaceae bacterium]
MTPPPRLGFLGVGWIGRSRMEAIAQSGAATVAAVADISPALVRDAMAIAPDAEGMATLEELLDAELDGIVIATPSAMHAEQSIAALERGISVFCQKPLARTAAESARVVEAARAADRLLGVDLSYRHTSAMRATADVVRSGGIGDVFAVDLVFHNAYGPDKPWFYDRARSGGGCVIDLGIHLVDLALWTLGFPAVADARSRLYAGGRPLRPASNAVEDYAEAQLVLETGAVVRLACSWKVSMGCDAVIGAAFHGTVGGAAMRNVNGSFYDLVAERYHGTQRSELVAPPDAWGGRAAVEWARRLAAGERFDREVERIVDVAAALDAIYDGTSDPGSRMTDRLRSALRDPAGSAPTPSAP